MSSGFCLVLTVPVAHCSSVTVYLSGLLLSCVTVLRISAPRTEFSSVTVNGCVPSASAENGRSVKIMQMHIKSASPRFLTFIVFPP